MTPEQFCYWLQGWVESEPDDSPSPEGWRKIAEKLQSVIAHPADQTILGQVEAERRGCVPLSPIGLRGSMGSVIGKG